MGYYFLIVSNYIYLFAIRMKHGIRVTSVYSIPMSLITYVLLVFATGYNLKPNGKNDVLECSSKIGVPFIGHLLRHLMIGHSGIISELSDQQN